MEETTQNASVPPRRAPGPRQSRVAISLAAKTIRMVVVGSLAFAGLVFSGGYLIGAAMGRSTGASPQKPSAAIAAVKKTERSSLPGASSGKPAVKSNAEAPAPASEKRTEPTPAAPTPAAPGLAAPTPTAPMPAAPQPAAAPLPKVEIRTKAPRARYMLQLGAYEDEQEARAFIQARAEELQGQEVYLLTKKIKDALWYRVRLGRYRSQRRANTAKRKLPEEVRTSAIVVRNR